MRASWIVSGILFLLSTPALATTTRPVAKKTVSSPQKPKALSAKSKVRALSTTRPAAKAKAAKKAKAPSSRPVKKRKKPISLLKFLQILKKKVEKSQKLKLRQKGKKAKKRPVKTVKTRCDPSRRHGKNCIGRVYGPKVTTQVVKCPLGGESVEIVRIKGMKVKGYDSDLRPHYNRYGQAAFIWICKRSLYAAYTGDFFKPFDKKKMKRALAPVRRAFQRYAKVTGPMRYIAAAAAYQARGKGPRFFGSFFLRAAWAAREAKDKEREGDMRRRAIMAMKIAFKRNRYKAKKQPSAAYLLGELNRQEKRFKKALFWLKKAMFHLNLLRGKNKTKGQTLENLIKRCEARAKKKDFKIYSLH